MDTKEKFSENVMLVDTEFLNGWVLKLRQVMSEALGRNLPDLDLVTWLTYLALDAGVRGEGNEIQVVLLHNEGERALQGCVPANLDELDGQACRTALGEFTFFSTDPAGIASREDMYMELMNFIQDAAEVKRLMLLPFCRKHGQASEDTLWKFVNEKKGKVSEKVLYFAPERLSETFPARWDWVGYSLMRAYNIKPGELE